jgi:hypothetical protein
MDAPQTVRCKGLCMPENIVYRFKQLCSRYPLRLFSSLRLTKALIGIEIIKVSNNCGIFCPHNLFFCLKMNERKKITLDNKSVKGHCLSASSIGFCHAVMD